MRRVPLVLALAVLLVLAGCGSHPLVRSPDPATLSVSVSNEAPDSYVVTVSRFTGPPKSFGVTHPSDATWWYPNATGVDDLPPDRVSAAVSVEAFGQETLPERFDLRPDDRVERSLPYVGPTVTVVVSVANPSLDRPMRALSATTCAPEASDPSVTVTIHEGGRVEETVRCEN